MNRQQLETLLKMVVSEHKNVTAHQVVREFVAANEKAKEAFRNYRDASLMYGEWQRSVIEKIEMIHKEQVELFWKIEKSPDHPENKDRAARIKSLQAELVKAEDDLLKNQQIKKARINRKWRAETEAAMPGMMGTHGMYDFFAVLEEAGSPLEKAEIKGFKIVMNEQCAADAKEHEEEQKEEHEDESGEQVRELLAKFQQRRKQ